MNYSLIFNNNFIYYSFFVKIVFLKNIKISNFKKLTILIKMN